MIRPLLRPLLAGAALLGLAAAAHAQDAQEVAAEAGQEMRVDWIGTVHKDCSVGEPPAVKADKVASHGVIRLTGGTVTTKRIPSCPEIKVPARVVFYKPTAGYSGPDSFTLRVGEGDKARTKTYRVTVK